MGSTATMPPPTGRRAREEWLRSLPVEERVRAIFGDDEDGDGPPAARQIAMDGSPVIGDDCYFPGCGRPRIHGRLCQGHKKQRDRGIPLRPLMVKHRPGDPVPPCVDCGTTEGAARTKGRCGRCYCRARRRAARRPERTS
jgi:hypothetical protein